MNENENSKDKPKKLVTTLRFFESDLQRMDALKDKFPEDYDTRSKVIREAVKELYAKKVKA